MHLLPALPPQLAEGRITGLPARGGLSVGLDRTGGTLRRAQMKVLRMDERPVENEVHGATELLLVLDGELKLLVDRTEVTVGPGEM
ncbi:glycoside hydrolase family 95-like protein [Streptomyces sp. CRN 30]|uniref:glycoside hydrolase family 95-like protein n=1 Tax=Streptomyces sp. CRN 30 TaxID=3075613 RepID=UPI002A83E5FE|nr:hypothetical protein [Streptomyces sp. CRN 30]